MHITNKGLISKNLKEHQQNSKKKKTEQKNKQGINQELTEKETWNIIFIYVPTYLPTYPSSMERESVSTQKDDKSYQ